MPEVEKCLKKAVFGNKPSNSIAVATMRRFWNSINNGLAGRTTKQMISQMEVSFQQTILEELILWNFKLYIENDINFLPKKFWVLFKLSKGLTLLNFLLIEVIKIFRRTLAYQKFTGLKFQNFEITIILILFNFLQQKLKQIFSKQNLLIFS